MGGGRKKNLRRLLLVLSGMALLLSLAGCGGQSTLTAVPTTTQTSVAVQLTVS